MLSWTTRTMVDDERFVSDDKRKNPKIVIKPDKHVIIQMLANKFLGVGLIIHKKGAPHINKTKRDNKYVPPTEES